MAKINISESNLIIVLHQDFLVFSFNQLKTTWDFFINVKCTDSIKNSNGSIECCAFSPCGNYFGVYFDKNIIIYSTSNWNALYIYPGERKASDLQFFPKSKVIVVADKSGCASFYLFKESELQKNQLALGHNSMLTRILVTDDEKYLITSDRDEKIRVTNYPNVYNIEKFCLGHEMFVSCLAFLPTDKHILISSSGDGTIRFWNFILGEQLAVYNCNSDTNENSKATIIKFVTCRVKQMSFVAILEYKSNKIKIINVKGDLKTGLKLELTDTLTLNSIPWDIGFQGDTLLCLLPNKNNPIIFWSPHAAATESKKSFDNVVVHLTQNWDSFLTTTSKISDEIPVLFKREVDNIQEYEQRKKARLLKTGKTS